jgi:phage gpG-like protein
MAGKALSLPEATAELDRMAAAAGPAPEPLMKVLAVAVGADAKENFDRGVDPDDKPWAPLAFRRPSSQGSDKPLRDTGLLMASVIGQAQGHVERVSPGMLIVGTNRLGAALMQDGGTVVPKAGKALAIPLTREAAAVGSPRSFPRQLFLLWRKGATSGVLAERVEKGRGKNKLAEVVAQFALVAKAVVPARRFLGAGKRLIGKLNRIIRGWYAERFGKGA